MSIKYIKKVAVTEIPEINGSIVDGTNIEDKTTNTYSANTIDGLVLDTYSTTEQVVGTWIDGKPLYRKTIYSTSTSGSTGFSKENTGFMRYTNVNIRSNEFIFPPSRYTNAEDTLDFFLNTNNGEFSIQIGTAWASGFKYVTFDLEYTKK